MFALPYPNIDPVILNIYGPFAIRWYGMMYVLGFTFTYLYMMRQSKRGALLMNKIQIQDFFFWGVVGVLLGGRLGYVLIYSLPYHLANPMKIFAVWEGGMSFHGGLTATMLIAWWYMRKHKLSFLNLGDTVVIGGCVGLFLSRIGNFINGELYGRVTDLPWGIIFPSGGPLPRHPSQLYESLGEGFFSFIILWTLKDRMRRGQLLFLYLCLYGGIRFVIEFFRQPDVQMGFYFGWMTMGQILCLIMIIGGLSGLYFVTFKLKTPWIRDHLK
jgi:phosphatidylglycerol---prolipoprotein diacylglyceryl transferase